MPTISPLASQANQLTSPGSRPDSISTTISFRASPEPGGELSWHLRIQYGLLAFMLLTVAQARQTLPRSITAWRY